MSVSDADNLTQEFKIEIADNEDADVIGEIVVYCCHVPYLESEKISLYDAFDSVDADCEQMISSIEHCEEDVAEAIGDYLHSLNRLWYVQFVEVKPEFRGRGLGRWALARFLQFHMSVNEAAIIRPGEYECSRTSLSEKLVKYWEYLGFKQLPHSHYLVASYRQLEPRLARPVGPILVREI
jgi:GNAT superfamily N-acetyltransferase